MIMINISTETPAPEGDGGGTASSPVNGTGMTSANIF